MKIYVDADACPVKEETYKVALRYALTVVLVSNAPMRFPEGNGVTLEVVPGGFDAADDWIAEHVGPEDIVVTAAVPLASRCVAAGAGVINATGKIFTEKNIGDTLGTRNLMADLRGAGMITGGPAPFGKKDRSRFLEALDGLIHKVRRR